MVNCQPADVREQEVVGKQDEYEEAIGYGPQQLQRDMWVSTPS